MSEIIPFDFEEQAVRVVLRDGEPWFVAADVCRVLEIGNPSDAVGRLEDDERMTLDTIEGQTGRGGARMMNIISESGLYALIFTSRKEAAKRFRKWVTAEVLPSIRRHGRYELPEAETVDPALPGMGTIREAELWLSMVREARLLAGTKAGLAMWSRSPLPPLTLPAPKADPAEARACLDWLIAQAPLPLSPALVGDDDAAEWLAGAGLRALEHGLFVGNAARIFAGTRWAGGFHRPLLMSLPGVAPDTAPRRLAGVQMRGVILPFTLFTMEAEYAA
jgi:prophage antirepressor-like protein